MSYSASTHRVRSPYTSPSIGPDLMCILDEDDDEDAIDTVKSNIIQKIDNKNFTLKKLTTFTKD